ncbi:MAG: hypothetical protein CL489_09040 [Acidobacteria bacterium]|nr:hypothetical protein [Acidobacteriota bacterium]|tara:strand:- start:26609 stop:26884 length:276 start_codon:yes stop_codon:yes gene_type:complete
MKNFKNWLAEAETDSNLIDDVIDAIKGAGMKPKTLDKGDNFNVAFKKGDTEYYVKPNDEGKELFYIDADVDDFKTFKVKDIAALKSKLKDM